ncbi:hypothetical protein K461DRAFT_27842 [Myriangium duriaei CBS 260.36]|uniref:HPP transmembrane region domain-containing protein n=1 Tax=Myriangium duriaei CBS 260.36 TaxID=1168546 RepID=A0A9P4JAE9_9PEZI|nr:hypothetical protein K461DRAFT_27842 [Myriangium duriaei CBS 260.36]
MPKRTSIKQAALNFDIDKSLNPYLPPSILPRLPRPISHFLGYRPSQPSDLPSTLVTLHSTAAIFIALLCVSSINKFSNALIDIKAPPLIPSLGAGAALNLCALSNPTAQPRHTILGQGISATVATGIAKGFKAYGTTRASELEWLSAPLACAAAVLAMRLTNTLHPPGGATAVLAITTTSVSQMGWWFVLVIMMGATVMVGVGCVVNNIGRRWPLFWWSGEEMGGKWKKEGKDQGESEGEEKGKEESGSESDDEEKKKVSEDLEKQERDPEVASERTLAEGRCPCCGRS